MPFFIAWIAGVLLVPLVCSVAIKLGIVDNPGHRKIHTKPIPRLGGVAIYLAVFLGALPLLEADGKTAGLLLAATFIFVIGFLDDLLDLPPKLKLAGQLVACLILVSFNVRIDFITDFISGRGLVTLGLLTYPLTVAWVVGLTNTVNLVDGVDGLAGGIVFIAMGTLLAVRLLNPQIQDPLAMANVIVISSAMMGALLAFLKFNVFPAAIFMGDSGAYFLGFMTASLSVVGAAKGSILFPLVVPLIAFGLPVIDVGLAILRRYFRKTPIFQGDKEHLHHKLLNLGFSQADTTRFLWMVSSCFGLLAILTSGFRHRGLVLTVSISLIFMVIICIGFYNKRVKE